MDIRTHLSIDQQLNGVPVDLSPGRAIVQLKTTPSMTADDHGLVHGGFLFGAADYAAMLAVNDPNVVLAGAQMRFKAPVRLGEAVHFEANITEESGRKRMVDVVGAVDDRVVFTGTFTTAVLDQHVLSGVSS